MVGNYKYCFTPNPKSIFFTSNQITLLEKVIQTEKISAHSVKKKETEISKWLIYEHE